MNNTLFLILVGLGGVSCHVLMKLIKLNALNDGLIDWVKFIRLERFHIILSIFVVILSSILSKEIKDLAFAGKAIGLGQFCIGYFAQSILTSLANKAEKNIKSILKK